MLIREQNFRERWLLIISKQMLIRLTEMVMELSDTYLQSVTSDIMIAERVKIGVQIAKEYADDADTFSKKIYDVIGSGVGIIESVPAAISIAYYTQDPNECCLMCANLGGDTDTIGAMATAICGAFTGYSKINPEYTELLRVQNSETDFDEYINILKKGRKLAGCGR